MLAVLAIICRMSGVTILWTASVMPHKPNAEVMGSHVRKDYQYPTGTECIKDGCMISGVG